MLENASGCRANNRWFFLHLVTFVQELEQIRMVAILGKSRMIFFPFYA